MTNPILHNEAVALARIELLALGIRLYHFDIKETDEQRKARYDLVKMIAALEARLREQPVQDDAEARALVAALKTIRRTALIKVAVYEQLEGTAKWKFNTSARAGGHSPSKARLQKPSTTSRRAKS